ncbi:MAG: T9SS type A sorting domain-containing protein [Bacteroidales bacterium]
MRKCYIVIILIAQVWRVALLAQVATPNGTQIDYKILSEGNIAILEAQAAQWLSDRGWTDSVYRIGPATNKYNCHSYAWYKKEGGGNDYWINAFLNSDLDAFNRYSYYSTPPAPNNINRYWNDYSYIEVDVVESTKVWFGSCWQWTGYEWSNSCDHSAVRLPTGLYESKWGAWPLYRHPADKCPYSLANRKYFKRGPYLAGPSVICSSGATFEVSNLPGGVSASWSASPSYYFTTTSGTGSAFLTAWTGGFRKGVGTITATLVTSCDTFNLTKSVWAGTPASPTAITLLPDDGVCRGPAYYYQLGLLHPYPSYVSSWYWDLQSPGVIIGSRTGSSLKFYYPSGTTPGRYSVAVKAVNPCGDSSYHIEYFDVIDCDRMEMVSFNIYPNPVRDVLNVEITANDAVEINPEAITELRIYDTFLSLKKQLTFSGSTVSVNTGDLPQGVYLMQFVTAEDFLRLTDSNDATKLEALKQRVFWSKFEKIP